MLKINVRPVRGCLGQCTFGLRWLAGGAAAHPPRSRRRRNLTEKELKFGVRKKPTEYEKRVEAETFDGINSEQFKLKKKSRNVDENGESYVNQLSLMDAMNWVTLAKNRDTAPNRGVMSVVMSVFHQHKKLECMWEVMVLARKHGHKMPSRSYMEFIQCLRKRDQFDEAMAVYHRMGRDGVRASMKLNQYVLHVCAVDKRARDLDFIVAYLNEQEVELGYESLATLVLAYGRVGYRKEMLEAYERLRNLNLKYSWDFQTVSHVIDGFGHMKEVKLLEQVLFDLRDRGKLLKDICVMGALARARGELGDVDGLREVHDQMKMLKIDGRDIAQNALIDAYGRVGETAEVVRIYEQNLFNLGEERARLATREGVAKAFANVGSTEGVLSIMEAELKTGRNSRALHNQLIRAHGVNGNLDGAVETLDRMYRLRITPNSETLSWMCFAASRAERDSEARTKYHFKELQKNPKTRMTHTAFQSVVDVYLRAGNFQGIPRVFKAMLQNRLRPNFEMYESIADYFAHLNDLPGCAKIFAESSEFYEVDEDMLRHTLEREIILKKLNITASEVMNTFTALSTFKTKKIIPLDPLGRSSPFHGVLDYKAFASLRSVDDDHLIDQNVDIGATVPQINLAEATDDIIRQTRPSKV